MTQTPSLANYPLQMTAPENIYMAPLYGIMYGHSPNIHCIYVYSIGIYDAVIIDAGNIATSKTCPGTRHFYDMSTVIGIDIFALIPDSNKMI